MTPTTTRNLARMAPAFSLLIVGMPPTVLAQPASTVTPATTETVRMSVFEVSSDRDIGYRAVSSIAGSRTGEDLKNVPMPISVLTEEFMRDIDATDILEAARFSTGARGMPTDDNDQQAFQFRGFRSQYQTRNLFVWQAPTDAYNVERIDIARGPNALLFGDSEPGGVANFNTKRAHFVDRTALALRVGSWEQYRGTLDVNRKLTRRWAGRLNTVYDTRESWENWGFSNRRAVDLATTFTPGPNTTLRAGGEIGRFSRAPVFSLPVDAFSAWNGVTPFAFNAATGPAGTARLSSATGVDYWVWDNLVGRFENWRGFGQTNAAAITPARPVKDSSIVPRGAQFGGPDKRQRTDFHTYGGSIEHRIGEKFSVLGSFNVQNITENLFRPGNAAVRRDPNPTRPDGTANPNYGGYYVEYQWTDQRSHDLIYDGRIDAVYDWKPLRWMSQRLYATAGLRTGRNNVATLAQVRSNNTAVPNFNNAQNAIRRRIYLSYGDTVENTAQGVPGSDPATGIATAFMQTGATSRLWTDLAYAGVGASGTYWNGRFRTNLGIRRDEVQNDIQTAVRDAGSGLMAYTAPRQKIYSLRRVSPTAGFTAHPFRVLTLFGNYAKTFRPAPTTNTNPLGESVAPRLGEGREAGVRVELLEGRVYVSASTYDITQTGQLHGIGPTVMAVNAIWTDPLLNGRDPTLANRVLTGGNQEAQTLNARGYEIELWTNLTPSWSLTAGYGNNINKVSETDVSFLRYIHANLPEWQRLAATDAATRASIEPELIAIDEYLREAVPGLVRGRSNRDTVNLFTRYSFREGKLGGLTIGGGMSYRSPAALNSQFVNAVVTTIWGSTVTEYEAMAAYSFRLGSKYRGRVQLNVRNLFDRSSFDELTLSQTRYAAPRSFTLTSSLSF